MSTKIAALVLLTVPLMFGCAIPSSASDQATSAANAAKTPAPDATVAVKQFVQAHGEVMAGIGDIKASNQKAQGDLDTIKSTNQRSLETAQRSLKAIEDMASRQGTGELSVFFPTGSAQLERGSIEYERLVRFADFLAHESRGRKIILVSIGSASAFGSTQTNRELAKKRAQVPLDVLDKYLVNVPHEFHKVFDNGDLNSPKGVKMKEHQRYQHTRIIAVFDKEQVANFNEVSKG